MAKVGRDLGIIAGVIFGINFVISLILFDADSVTRWSYIRPTASGAAAILYFSFAYLSSKKIKNEKVHMNRSGRT